jgi:nucleotide-binding universal stress UspA family protein
MRCFTKREGESVSGPDQIETPAKFLVCVDGSEIGFKATGYAIALAVKLRSKLVLLNVVGALASEKEYNITADMAGSFELLGEESLAKAEEMAKKSGVTYEKIIADGDPADEIIRYAKELECDCIVIGRMGLTKTEKLVVGSVSEQVLNNAAIPVIVVK